MSLFRLLRSVSYHRPKPTSPLPLSHFFHNVALNPSSENPIQDPPTPPPQRSYAFTSAEEAAAERRRRKRRLRIEPPIHALRASAPSAPPTRDPNAPRLPDSTSALVGHRLHLHNRVQSLIRASDLDAASLLARSSVFSSTRPTVFTCNAIIAAMYRNKRFNEAIGLFHFFFKQSDLVPNVVSYNNLINTHCDMGEVDVALQVYREILEKAPFNPSAVTYRHLTKGLIDAGRIGEAVDMLREMLNKGHGADSLVFNNLISGFLNLGNLDKANELFDELKERCLVYDGVVNGTFMEWWFNQGKDKEAMESYRSLLDRKFKMPPPTCNTLLEVLLKHGKSKEAWALFEEMLDNHTPPNTQAVNSDTFNIMVNECFKLGNVEEAILTFNKVGTKAGSKRFSMDTAGYNNIITRFCELGMLDEVDKFYQELCGKSLAPDVSMYRTMIDAYLKAERVDDALQSFTKMVEAGLRVVAGFGTRVFGELLKNGKNMEAAALLTKMGEKDPKPDASIYDVVVRGLCNAEELDKSLDILDQMMKYSIGVTPALQEFVRGAFGKVGRNEEIDRVLDENRWRSAAPSHQPRSFGQSTRSLPRPAETGGWQSSGSPRIGGGPRSFVQSTQSPSGPAETGGWQSSGSPQMGGGPRTFVHPTQSPSGPAETGGWQSSGSPQMGGGPRSFVHPTQSPSGPAETGGWQSSGPPQMRGGPRSFVHPTQSPSGPAETGGWQSSSSPQMGGGPRSFGQSTWSASRPAETGGWQSSDSQQMGGGQQYSGPSQVPGQQPRSWRSG